MVSDDWLDTCSKPGPLTQNDFTIFVNFLSSPWDADVEDLDHYSSKPLAGVHLCPHVIPQSVNFDRHTTTAQYPRRKTIKDKSEHRKSAQPKRLPLFASFFFLFFFLFWLWENRELFCQSFYKECSLKKFRPLWSWVFVWLWEIGNFFVSRSIRSVH